MDAMIEQSQPDIVSILTPSGMHFQHAAHIIRTYGIPVIVEKPLALTVADTESLTLLSQLRRVPLFTVLQNRFNVAVHLLRQNFKRLGDIVSANVCVRWARKQVYYQDWHGTWEQAGGVLANQAIHHIDLLTWLLGMPRGVFAYENHTRSSEVEDTLVGVLRYHNDAIANIEVTAAATKDLEGSLTIIGERGMVKVGGFAVNRIDVWEFDEEQPEDAAIRNASENPPDVYGFGHRQFYYHVLQCLQAGVQSPIDGRYSVRVVNALYQSVEQHREIGLLDMPVSNRLGL
jgi:predicted dehydrogenase